MRLLPFGLFLLVSVGAVLAAPDPQLTTSDHCGSCHRDIYRMWHGSAHARSMDDPNFLEVFRESEILWGHEQSRVCLNCHAPMVQVNDDWELVEKITWEGVSCDVCHSLVSVDLSGLGPRMTLDPGPVKRGPIRDAASTEHEVAYSELHEEALVCAPCHEYVNPEATPIMTTFSEWKESGAAARGSTCQTCHMARTKADVVDPRVKRSKLAEVNLHEVPGGHSRDQLYNALDVSYEPARVGDELSVEVRIMNQGAGHAVPTGMPGRQIVLTLEVATGAGESFEDRRVFGKTLVDATGERITHTWGYFSKGVRTESDTRIQADEEWSEVFRYAVPATAPAFLNIRLEYEVVADEVAQPTHFTFYSERRVIKPKTIARSEN